MSDRERTLWPFKPRLALVAAVLILFGLLFMLVILRLTMDWPSEESETAVLLGIFLLSLLPIMLVLLDTVIERGGVVEYAGVKIDFSQVQRAEISGPTIPANIGVPGHAVSDSGTNNILDALREAVNSGCVIVDLEEGQAWWETRLLVLLVGAIRHNKPEIVIFVGTDGGMKKCFQGWAFTDALLPHLLDAHPKYKLIYYRSLAAVRPWESIEPPGIETGVRHEPTWVQPGLAILHKFWAFDSATGLPNPFFAEQLLASELGDKIEQVEPPRTISLVRLADLFRSVLHREHIDGLWTSERQLEVFFGSDRPYVAVTQNGQFKSLVSRLSVLNTMVGKLVMKK